MKKKLSYLHIKRRQLILCLVEKRELGKRTYENPIKYSKLKFFFLYSLLFHTSSATKQSLPLPAGEVGNNTCQQPQRLSNPINSPPSFVPV